MAGEQFLHQRGPSEWTLFIPEEAMPDIMSGMRDTQSIHTSQGARDLGLPAPLLPGVFLSAHARYIADVFHEKVGGVEGSAQLGQRTRFGHPAFVNREIHLTVEEARGQGVGGQEARGQYKVIGEMRVGGKERKVFQSTIQRGEPDLEATVEVPEPISSYDVARGRSELAAIEMFYDSLGTPRAVAGEYRDDEDLSRTLAYAVPPMLEYKEQLVANGELDSNFTITTHSIHAIRNYHILRAPRHDGTGFHEDIHPARTTRLDLVHVDADPLREGKRGTFELLAWNGASIPSYHIEFVLSPLSPAKRSLQRNK